MSKNINMPEANNYELGLFGQKIAAKYLHAKGYKLLESNYNKIGAEIDLIMRDGAYIVFIEVKYRRDQSHGLPRESVTPRKQKQIKKAALYYITSKKLSECDFRFDVTELLGEPGGLMINHIENAFW